VKLSEIKQLLATRGIRLTKSLGQNFLHDANQLRRIVAATEVNCADRVLEIGPGLGALTELLAAKAGEVVAIEKDHRLIENLQDLNRPPVATSHTGSRNSNVTLIHADALDFLRREPRDWSDWKVVSNLPYSVASPILVALTQVDKRPVRVVVTLQLEVAKRLAARTGSSDYGVLTLLVGLHYEPEDFFKIPASCFFPEPEVDSACICLVRRQQSLLPTHQEQAFRSLVKRGFSQRRKMLMKLLKEDWPRDKLAQVFEQLQLSSQVRAEDVNLEQFVRMTQALVPSLADSGT